jgi:hypothetical protein
MFVRWFACGFVDLMVAITQYFPDDVTSQNKVSSLRTQIFGRVVCVANGVDLFVLARLVWCQDQIEGQPVPAMNSRKEAIAPFLPGGYKRLAQNQ